MLCAQCGKKMLNRGGAHAFCCAKGESTKGHYAVVRKIFDVVKQVDAGAETEAAGLINSAPILRPADILSTAVSDCAAALDLGIASPDAAHAGTDCTETMWRAKKSKYAPYEAELSRQNIQYRPIIFSAYGRPHPDAQKFLSTLSRRLARRRCFASAASIRRQLEKNIAVEIWRRAARMVAACWAQTSPVEE